MFPYQRIVIITPKRLGDTLFCTPAIHLLKKHQPQIQLDIIALSELSAKTLQYNPAIQDIFVLPKQELVSTWIGKYDLAINFHDNERVREYIDWLQVPALHMSERVIERHQAIQALEFIQSLLQCKLEPEDYHYCLYPQTADFAHAKQQLQQQGVEFGNNILVGFHMGCHGIAKKRWWQLNVPAHRKAWALEHYIELAQHLSKHDKRIRIVLTGAKGEHIMGLAMEKAGLPVINLIDKLSILEMAAAMNSFKVLVVGDTGALHVACARQIPLVALFGPTHLSMTGPQPMQPQYTILQRDPLNKLATKEVYAAVVKCLVPI